jgi:hypothetical protein
MQSVRKLELKVVPQEQAGLILRKIRHCGIDVGAGDPGRVGRSRRLQFVAAADPVLPILDRFPRLLVGVQPSELG